jgi:integrase
MGKLTAASVRGLVKPGRYADGQGLFLDVRGSSRAWVYRYQLANRERLMSLGSAEEISLAEARQCHAEARSLVLRHLDPLDARQASRACQEAAAAASFADAAAAYIEAHKADWRGPRSVEQWRNMLRDYADPAFGVKPVADVSREDVLRCLTPIWTTKAPTARILRNRIELVIDYSIARNWRQAENPARWRGGLKMLLAAKHHTTVHRPALPWQDAPALMAQLAPGSTMAAKCLAFVALTATRSAEARGCRWSEIDVEAAVWTIPSARMKAAKDHRVPLSGPAMAILRELAELRTGDLVFLGRDRGRPLTDTTLRDLMQKLHPGITVHGLRSTFRDWCADHGQPSDLAEMALAHTVGNVVERSYRRSDVLERRRVLMEQWAQFLTRAPAQVVPLARVPLRQVG